jgi:hypothetical protein
MNWRGDTIEERGLGGGLDFCFEINGVPRRYLPTMSTTNCALWAMKIQKRARAGPNAIRAQPENIRNVISSLYLFFLPPALEMFGAQKR